MLIYLKRKLGTMKAYLMWALLIFLFLLLFYFYLMFNQHLMLILFYGLNKLNGYVFYIQFKKCVQLTPFALTKHNFFQCIIAICIYENHVNVFFNYGQLTNSQSNFFSVYSYINLSTSNHDISRTVFT